MEGDAVTLGREQIRGIVTRGGTILGTSRFDPYVHGAGFDSVRATVEQSGIERLVVIGGDGSLRTASRLQQDGLPIVGVPKTIDNDIGNTDVTFGFHSAVQIATDAIDRLTTTAESHDRIMVVEVMGRTAGWIAAYAGLAGGAEAVLVPEVAYDIDEVARRLRARHESGPDYSIVVVAEGAPSPTGGEVESGIDAFGFARLGGIGAVVAHHIEQRTGYETRVTVLGHLQRGGSPTAFDRVLATRMGVEAGAQAMAGSQGVMIAVHSDEIVAVDLASSCATVRPLPAARYEDLTWFLV